MLFSHYPDILPFAPVLQMTASHQNPVQSISVLLESKAHLVNQGLVQFQMFNVCIVPTIRGIIIMYVSHEMLRLSVNLRRVGHSLISER